LAKLGKGPPLTFCRQAGGSKRFLKARWPHRRLNARPGLPAVPRTQVPCAGSDLPWTCLREDQTSTSSTDSGENTANPAANKCVRVSPLPALCAACALWLCALWRRGPKRSIGRILHTWSSCSLGEHRLQQTDIASTAQEPRCHHRHAGCLTLAMLELGCRDLLLVRVKLQATAHVELQGAPSCHAACTPRAVLM